MFDVSSASRQACRAVLFDKLDTAKMYVLVSIRELTSQVEFGLNNVVSVSSVDSLRHA